MNHRNVGALSLAWLFCIPVASVWSASPEATTTLLSSRQAQKSDLGLSRWFPANWQDNAFDIHEVSEPVIQLAQREGMSTGDLPPEPHPAVPLDEERRPDLEALAETENTTSLFFPGYGTNTLLPAATGLVSTATMSGLGGGRLSEDKPFTAALVQTVDYVTNLALPFTVTPSNQVFRTEDYQFQTNASAQLLLASDGENSLSAYANYYQSLHAEVVFLDLNAATTGLIFDHTINDDFLVSFVYDYSYFWLDDTSLFSRNRVGSVLTYHACPHVDYQAAYYFSDTNYRWDDTQTSTSHAAQLQRVQYLDDARTDYLFLGYLYGYNNADSNVWTYNLHSAFLGSRFLVGPAQKTELFMLGSYGNFAFSGPDPIEAIRRVDNTWSLSNRLAYYITPSISLFGQYSYFDSESNITRQDFASHLWSIGTSLAW